MNTVIWTIQGILCVGVTLLALMRIFLPAIKLQERMPLVKGFSATQVKFIGFTLLLGGIGVILPSLIFNRWSLLTPIAAIGLGLIMLVAAIDHIYRKEIKPLFPLAAFISMAVFIVYQFVLHYTEVSYSIYQYRG